MMKAFVATLLLLCVGCVQPREPNDRPPLDHPANPLATAVELPPPTTGLGAENPAVEVKPERQSDGGSHEHHR